MEKTRVETFSDGVIAIILTIMVLELKVPHGTDVASLLPLIPILLSYVLSFLYLAIYWNNHHHMFHTVRKVTGGIMWANMNLLFWLSLIPFTTSWMGENHFSKIPTAFYGMVLLLAAISYWLLQQTIIHSQGHESLLKKAIGHDIKGKFSPVMYVLGIAFALELPWLAQAIYAAVALMWIVPDRRIERLSKL